MKGNGSKFHGKVVRSTAPKHRTPPGICYTITSILSFILGGIFAHLCKNEAPATFQHIHISVMRIANGIKLTEIWHSFLGEMFRHLHTLLESIWLLREGPRAFVASAVHHGG